MKKDGINMRFEFSTASRILFGKGVVEEVPQLLLEKGKRLLFVTGKNPERFVSLIDMLKRMNLDTFVYTVSGEPTIDVVSTGVQIARENGCDVVAGIGGGSVIDTAKAISAIIPNGGELLDYLEVIGASKILQKNPLPFVAIPTTAGTGAEVTKNSVLLSPKHGVKVSLRSPLMFPDVAVIDPELTYSMPPNITASTGMDAFSQLLEAYVSLNSNYMTDMVCRDGMKRVAKSLYRCFKNGKNVNARENMAMASLLGGIALANAKLGAVHGFAGPIGGMFSAPHGAVCACLLPYVLEMNIKILRIKKLDQYLMRYVEVAKILTGKQDVNAEDGVDWVSNLNNKLKIPKLSDFGITVKNFPEIVEKAKNASSTKGNPVKLTDEELLEILQKAA
jgi:alcohol dehydrogenase class IV